METNITAETAIVKYVFRQYAHCAARRNIAFNIDIATFLELANAPCVYCLASNTNTAKRLQYAVKTWNYNGVDRVNSDLTYSIGNVVSCCGACNAAKANQELYTFLGSDWLKERQNEVANA